jgi:hypothetical protein
VRMEETKFAYNQRVKIARGFFRGHTGFIRGIKQRWWHKKTKFYVHLPSEWDHLGTGWYDDDYLTELKETD